MKSDKHDFPEHRRGRYFLVVILIASIFVYPAVRRQIRLQHQQENFMMAITHELKTPIAIAKLNLETLLKYSFQKKKSKDAAGNPAGNQPPEYPGQQHIGIIAT